MKFTLEETEQLCVSLRDLIDRDTDAIRAEERLAAQRAFDEATKHDWPGGLDKWQHGQHFVTVLWQLKSVAITAMNQRASQQVADQSRGVFACVLTTASSDEINTMRSCWDGIMTKRNTGA